MTLRDEGALGSAMVKWLDENKRRWYLLLQM